MEGRRRQISQMMAKRCQTSMKLFNELSNRSESYKPDDTRSGAVVLKVDV
jgi:hypothetical protein